MFNIDFCDVDQENDPDSVFVNSPSSKSLYFKFNHIFTFSFLFLFDVQSLHWI